jgi:hypothetical protein
MKEYSERVILNCGDALFIPEGWYIFLNFILLHLVSEHLNFGHRDCSYSLQFCILGHYLNFQIPRKQSQLINNTIYCVGNLTCSKLIKHVACAASFSMVARSVRINEYHRTKVEI